MSRTPLLAGSPQILVVWGLIFFLPVLAAILFLSGLAAEGDQGKYFRVEMLSPHYFRIRPLIRGPVSSILVGGGTSRQLINRWENGQTVIYARVPPGATLTIRVRDCYLWLWMQNSGSFQFQEGCKSRSLNTGLEERQEGDTPNKKPRNDNHELPKMGMAKFAGISKTGSEGGPS